MTIATTPKPPYYAVIFSSQRMENKNDYDPMSKKMLQLAQQQDGFLGVESVSSKDGFDLTISYWDSLKSIQHWKEHAAHQAAKQKGKENWFRSFKTRICKVEQDYDFSRSPLHPETTSYHPSEIQHSV